MWVAVGFAARAEFRDQLLAQSETMKAALDGVMNATPAMFKVFVAAELVATPAGRSPEPDRVGENRLLLANWVEMLMASRRALDAAVVAAGSEGGVGVGEVLASSQSLITLAQDVRRALAGGERALRRIRYLRIWSSSSRWAGMARRSGASLPGTTMEPGP